MPAGAPARLAADPRYWTLVGGRGRRREERARERAKVYLRSIILHY